MTTASESPSGRGILMIAAALVVIIYGVNLAQSVVSLFLVSIFLALIATPPVLWLRRKRFPPFLAVVTIMTGMIILLLMIGAVVGSSLDTLSEALPFYQERLHDQVVELRTLLASKNIAVTEKVLLEYLNPGSIIGLTATLVGGMGSLLSNIALILLTVAFILLEASSFPVKLRSVLGDPERAFPQFTRFVADMQRYMIIKTVISLCAGAIVALWLFALGVDFPILWGFMAFLLHYVPNLGQIVAAVPPVLLALLQLGPGSAALVAAGYMVVGFVLGNIVEPRYMGQHLGLSTLIVFVSLLVWGGLLGPVGVILCVPLTMTVKFGFNSSDKTRWIAVLLGSEKASKHA